MSTKLRYSKEFRERAVRLSIESDQSVSRVAKELDISTGTLCNWRRRAGVSTPRKGPEADEIRELKRQLEEQRRENKRLEKEARLLNAERDILKKAAALFARDSK